MTPCQKPKRRAPHRSGRAGCVAYVRTSTVIRHQRVTLTLFTMSTACTITMTGPPSWRSSPEAQRMHHWRTIQATSDDTMGRRSSLGGERTDARARVRRNVSSSYLFGMSRILPVKRTASPLDKYEWATWTEIVHSSRDQFAEEASTESTWWIQLCPFQEQHYGCKGNLYRVWFPPGICILLHMSNLIVYSWKVYAINFQISIFWHS